MQQLYGKIVKRMQVQCLKLWFECSKDVAKVLARCRKDYTNMVKLLKIYMWFSGHNAVILEIKF